MPLDVDPATADPAAEDRALLAAHVAGDPDAFGTLFTRHRDRLWAVALRTTGNPEEAADALQDAMISAYRRADSFRGDAQVTTWLHRIVVNACLDRLRRAKVRATRPLPDDLDGEEARGRLLVADDTADPVHAAVSSDVRREVLAALERLPADQRAALVLVDMQGYPVEEAAAILDCPTGTVKSRCFRGRARLAGMLGHLGPQAAGTDPAGGTSHPRTTSTAPSPPSPVGADATDPPEKTDQQSPARGTDRGGDRP